MQAITIERMAGIIQGADEQSRKLYVSVNGDTLTLDVPEDCDIWLDEAQADLHQLTPLDHVRIDYADESGAYVAHSIHASWFPFSPEVS